MTNEERDAIWDEIVELKKELSDIKADRVALKAQARTLEQLAKEMQDNTNTVKNLAAKTKELVAQ